MAIDLLFRRRAVRTLTNQIGCYVLCDLDNVPIYVGQSVDGIRSRVNRHLTSARSDIIANRQVDVWEIAWVWAYPVQEKTNIGPLEEALFHTYNIKSALMNGKSPKRPTTGARVPEPGQVVQVMHDSEIAEKKDPALRLPRQAEHYSQIVGHFLAVKTQKRLRGLYTRTSVDWKSITIACSVLRLKSKAMSSTADRSAIMRAVKSRNTGPEMIVRRLAHRLGYRFRLHRADLPGKPDLVFAGRRKIIFVHGCWWHGHECRRGAREPVSNLAYWRAKIGRNVDRDRATLVALEAQGWRVATIWECQLKDQALLETRLRAFLDA